MSNPDIGRIKRNIAKMIDMGAPEADIDAYIQEEGVTLKQLQASKGTPSSAPASQSHTGGLTPRASHGGDNPDHIVDAKMATIAKALGVDIDKPLTPDQLQAFRDAYVKTEGSSTNNVGNLKNPGGNGFQVFATPEAGTDAIDAQIRRDYNRGQVSIRQLIEGYKIGEHPAPPAVRAEGDEAPPEDGPIGQEPVPVASGKPPAANPDPVQPADDSGFLGVHSLGQLGRGIAQGTGDVVEGLADIPGIALDPVNTLIGRAWGYKDYTADFGKTVRHGLGLPDSENHLSSEIIKGGSSALGTAGISRLLAKAGTGAVSEALKEFGSTPIRDTVGGATGAVGADVSGQVAQAAGLGPTGQAIASTLGGLAGGVGGYGAGTLAHNAKPEIRAENFAKTQAAMDPKAARYASEFVADLVKTHNTVNRGLVGPKPRAPLDVKTVNDVIDGYTDQLMEHVKLLGIPKSEQLRLQNAISRKHSLPQEEIDALRGTTEGDAVADAIEKTQVARRLTPEIARDPSFLTRAGQVVATGTDLLPIPGVVGRSIRWATKATAGDAEAARVHAAKRLLDKQNGYKKLGEIVGPSGQQESRAALEQAGSDAEGEAQLADIFKARDTAQARADSAALRAKAQEQNAAWTVRQEKGPTPLQRAQAKQKAFAAADQEAAAAKQAQEDAMWQQQANSPDAGLNAVTPVPVPKSQTNAEIAGWNDVLKIAAQRQKAKQDALKASYPNVDFTPPKPPKEAPAPKPKKVDPAQAAIEDAIAQGIPGDSGVQNAFAARLGIDPKDLPAVLDHVEQQVPDLAGEINRIRHNYPTQNRKIGSVLGGRMGKAVEELGIPPKAADAPAPAPAPAPVPVDEAAQARLDAAQPAPKPAPATPAAQAPIDFEAAKQADAQAGWVAQADGSFVNTKTGAVDNGGLTGGVSDDTGAPAAPASEPPKEAGPYYKQVRRQREYDTAKNRNISAGTDIIMDMTRGLSPDTEAAVGRMAEHVRDRIKTGDEARSFFDDAIMPELLASGAQDGEIKQVRQGIYDLAMIKPHQTQESLQAGAMTKGPGRSRKQN